MAEAVCPNCGEAAVEFEEVEGISACQACGWVLAEEQLVHAAVFDDRGAVHGTFVGGQDTGERAAAFALQSQTGGAVIKRGKSGDGESKLRARTREFCALLRLQAPVVEQALHVAGQAVPHVLGAWRRDHIAASATYAACRLNRVPLTLADVSAATQIHLHALGNHYTALCRLLELQPPLLRPHDLLPRSADRVAADALRSGRLSAATAAALRQDAASLLDWMQRHLDRRQFPMASVGTALMLAAEMNSVTLSMDHVCASLPLSRSTLEHKLAQVRQRLVQLAALLPYSVAITSRNVGSHTRTIMQLSALVGAAAAAPSQPTVGADVDGGNRAAASQLADERHGTLPSKRGCGQAQDAGARSAALPAGGAAHLQEGAEAQPLKRARVQGPEAVEQPAVDLAATHSALAAAQNRSPNNQQTLQQEQQQPAEPPG